MTVSSRYPLIVDIKRNSLDDGPGIRTTVFFKGCPLSCVWCQNPETKLPSQQIVYERESCIGCGACEAACKNNAMKLQDDDTYPVNTENCRLCGQCVSACIQKALHFAGIYYDTDTICRILRKDEVFYKNSNGGVTFSGGEPTLHMAYLAELSAKLKMHNIHIGLETCGFYNREQFEASLLPYLDFIYFDIKLFDRDEHIQYCGVTNDGILDNFRKLFSSQSVRVIPRIPLIPSITDTEANLTAIRRFFVECGVTEIGLLPYNPLWLSKTKTIGMKARYDHSEWLNLDEKDRIRAIFDGFQFKDI